MLVLSRKKNQGIVFPNIGMRIIVVGIQGDKVRLGIEAPPQITAHRDEVYEQMTGRPFKRTEREEK